MAISTIKATFNANIERVWKIVTSLDNYAWRSNLSKIEVINDKEFIEYTKDNYPTHFTITKTEENKIWEFDLENDNIKGHWKGIFTAKGTNTEIEFTEDVTAKKIIMKPFVKAFLKKQQQLYINDLTKELNNHE